MSNQTKEENLDQAFLSLISDFDHSLKLEETMIDENTINNKFLEHAGVQRKYVDEQTSAIVREMAKMTQAKKKTKLLFNHSQLQVHQLYNQSKINFCMR